MLHSLAGLSRQPAIYVALLLAFALQFYRLDARTFHGDELGSVAEAAQLGRNANSLPYFAFLKFWLVAGNGEFWLRSVSAFAAVAAVAVTFAWVRQLSGSSIGRLTALLLATSPFLLAYGQQVRFYSAALVAAGVCTWAFILVIRRNTRRAAVIWVLSAVAAIAALLLNSLLLLGQFLAAFALSTRLSTSRKTIVVMTLVILAAAAIMLPPVREFGFNALAQYSNADSRYIASRGLALSGVAKIPLTFFFFSFGESVYPLDYRLVAPGLFFVAVTFALGLWKLRRDPQAVIFVSAVILSGLALLYLVFDPLSPPTLQGAAPRYLIFLLPFFYFVLATGLEGRWSSLLIVPLLLVNTGSLASYWYGDWSYSDDLVNWRAVATWVGKYVTPQSFILLDGRSQETANYYFPSSWNSQNDYQYESAEDISPLLKYPRLILFADDFNPDPRVQASTLIQGIEKNYDRTADWSQYPLFIYVFDRKPSNPGTFRVDPGNGSVTIPVQVYGLEFQDVRLPISANVAGRSMLLDGAFALPGPHQEQTVTMPLDRPVAASRVVLLSTLTGAGSLPAGTPLATFRVMENDAGSEVIPIRLSYETGAWNSDCVPGRCTSAFRWLKRFALLGGARYPESWAEFEASIFSGDLTLGHPALVQGVELDRLPTPGTFYVWGIVLAP